jgi:glycerol-3-phosphate acyltransferase PlsY
LLILAVFAVAYFATRYVSLGSVLASAAFGVGFVVLHRSEPLVMVCGVFMSLLAIFMHRQNLLRLIKGEERKTDLFKKEKE